MCELIEQLSIRKLGYTVFIVLVQLRCEQVQLVALRVREEAAPTLFARLESCSPSRTPARSKCRGAANFRIDARVFRRNAEETTTAAPISLQTERLICDQNLKKSPDQCDRRLKKLSDRYAWPSNQHDWGDKFDWYVFNELDNEESCMRAN